MELELESRSWREGFISRRGAESAEGVEDVENFSRKESKGRKEDFGAGVPPQFTCRSLRRQDPEYELIDVAMR